MRKLQISMILLFCLMLAACTLATFLLPDKSYSIVENRRLQQKPVFTEKKFLKGKYQKKYESYLNDQFPFRDRWVDLSSLMQRTVGNKEINGVYIGKDGYLLEKNEEAAFEKKQAEENIEHLSFFLNNMAQSYGKGHVSCLMVPSKAQALSNRLPAFAPVPENKDVITALQRRLSPSVAFMDLQETLQSHQEEYIYYRTDHHWTTLGAYYAYRAWAEATGQAVPRPLEHYGRETAFTDFYGTTYNKAHIRGKADRVELFHVPDEDGIHISMDDGETEGDSLYFPEEARKGFNRYNVFFSKNTFKIDVTTKAGTGKKLLLIKDSFANCFVPFLTEDYDQIVMIDYRYGKLPIGKILKEYEDITDILVLFNTEKFMQNTKLDRLADIRTEGSAMEKFDPDSFLE